VADEEMAWVGEGLGAVRPYALVGGRVTPTRDLDRASLVQASVDPPADYLPTQYAEVFELCRPGPLSVAEIAGRLERPLQVVKIWLSDLLDGRYLVVPMPAGFTWAANDRKVLEEVIAGLRRL
jgi:Protein of unknown function (DUF742)